MNCVTIVQELWNYCNVLPACHTLRRSGGRAGKRRLPFGQAQDRPFDGAQNGYRAVDCPFANALWKEFSDR